MRRYLILLFVALISGCSDSSGSSTLSCALYERIALLDLDEMSPEKLREWVNVEYPNSEFEDGSESSRYDTAYTWQVDNVTYTANYSGNGKLLEIEAFIEGFGPTPPDTPRDVIRCMGEPSYYTATLVPPITYFSLDYPAMGVSLSGGLTERPNHQNMDDAEIQFISIIRPTSDLEQFLDDLTWSSYTYPIEQVHPWNGWESMEVYEGPGS